MLKRFGVDRPGCKIEARWCDDVPDRDPVQPGDVLEIEGSRHPVVGAKSYPGCFIEFFINEHWGLGQTQGCHSPRATGGT